MVFITVFALLLFLLIANFANAFESTKNIFTNSCNGEQQIPFSLQFMTDFYPQETSWKVINNADDHVEFQSDPYTEKYTHIKIALSPILVISLHFSTLKVMD